MTLGSSASSRKAFRFDKLLLSDRSATFRGQVCPGKTDRIASEAYEVVKDKLSPSWWEPIRRAVLRFSDVTRDVMDKHLLWEGMWTPRIDAMGPDPVASEAVRKMPIVISYIVRSGHRRTLIKEDHSVSYGSLPQASTSSEHLLLSFVIQGLVAALTTLCNGKGWELNVVHAERLSREEQVQVAARTTVRS